jgi:hypothetical protein
MIIDTFSLIEYSRKFSHHSKTPEISDFITGMILKFSNIYFLYVVSRNTDA